MIDPYDPVLDQPLVIDRADDAVVEATVRYRLANHDLFCATDVNADLHDLFWPWADEAYAHQITLTLSAPREDEFVPMVARRFPSHQEAIYGTEGIIVSKQLFTPYKSDYDRAVMWLLQCQAEGDRLLRVDVEIDWGEPLEQRMVDGLLVAQRGPQEAQGIYQQKNAESTRVFGNPEGRPSEVDINDPQRARLVYWVLINGTVEVPLLIAVSDVGEQMAWNGFLALRDGERVFDKSNAAWTKALKTGRLWTPDPRLNRAVYEGKIEAIHYLQRLRAGMSPSDRQIDHVPALVDSFDVFDVIQSHNLLAHLRRLAEKSAGRLPLVLPLRQKDKATDPGGALPQTNCAYLAALRRHLEHHFDQELLTRHYDAVRLCAEALLRAQTQDALVVDSAKARKVGLTHALRLAHWATDDVNMARWESEVAALAAHDSALAPTNWSHVTDDLGAASQDTLALAGRAIWDGCGLRWVEGTRQLCPTWPTEWTWWALMDLPIADSAISLVWDGTVLHTTLPIQSELPTQIHSRIYTRHTDELDFALEFAFFDSDDKVEEPTIFVPTFART